MFVHFAASSPEIENSILRFASRLLFQSNLHYTRGITPKRATSGRVDFHGIAPG